MIETLPLEADCLRLADVYQLLEHAWPQQIQGLSVIIVNEDSVFVRGVSTTPDLKWRIESLLRNVLPSSIRIASVQLSNPPIAVVGEPSTAHQAA